MDMPTAEDYIRAVQNPQLAFRQPRLKQARFDVHPLLGIPMPASGTTAIVFKATVDGQSQALRFLTRPDAASQYRYTALNHYFTERDLTRDVATSQWIDDAITVNGRPWPMLQMQWVEGRTLNSYVEDLVEAEDTASILSLAAAWRELLRRIQAARFAHGDLQHGNVLVEGNGTLRLVDFDSAWIEPFAGAAPPPESGHRNYQRVDRPWGPWMDTFPGLVIYLSLLALGRSTKAWEQLHTGENLLFSGQDFSPPHQTQTWWQLTQLSDPQLAAMADRLKVCCAPTWSATSDMETLLAAPLPWWSRTGTVAKPIAPMRPAPTAPPVRPNAPVAPGVWWSQSGPQQAPAAPPNKTRKTKKPKVAQQQKKRSALPVSILVWLVFAAAFAALSGNYLTTAVGALVSLVPAALTYTALSARRWRQLTKLPGRPR
jgi:eukaryotic-like serine/threonine-protein kinase